MFDWATGHYHRYGTAPSEMMFRRRWPGFVFLESPDPLDAVLDEFVRVVKRREGIEQIRHLSTLVDDHTKLDDLEVHFMESASELARRVPTTSVERMSDSFDRMEAHRLKQETGITPGISFIVPEIDDFTYGIGRSEMAVIEGSTSIGKSSLAVAMSGKSYFEKDETPLFISLEMEGEKLCQRWDAYAAEISYSAIKRGELQPDDYDKWQRVAEKASESRFEKDIVVIDDLYHPSVERVMSEVERWRPDFVVVDPIDEISAPSQYRTLYERQAYAARELKGIARSRGVPFVVMAQAGREAETEGAQISNIAGSIDIARKADLIVGLHASADMQKVGKIQFRLLKNRDDYGKGSTFDYKWDPSRMLYRPWRPEDAMTAGTSADTANVPA